MPRCVAVLPINLIRTNESLTVCTGGFQIYESVVGDGFDREYVCRGHGEYTTGEVYVHVCESPISECSICHDYRKPAKESLEPVF